MRPASYTPPRPAPPPAGPALTRSALAGDPGYARAQRRLTRDRVQERQQSAAAVAGGAEESYDQPGEAYNEAGAPMEPFHLLREREEGMFDSEGFYIPFDMRQGTDSWLESIDAEVVGTGEAAAGEGRREYPNNEPSGEPLPLGPAALQEYRRRLGTLLQPGESAEAALRRLGGGGAAAAKQVLSLPLRFAMPRRTRGSTPARIDT